MLCDGIFIDKSGFLGSLLGRSGPDHPKSAAQPDAASSSRSSAVGDGSAVERTYLKPGEKRNREDPEQPPAGIPVRSGKGSTEVRMSTFLQIQGRREHACSSAQQSEMQDDEQKEEQGGELQQNLTVRVLQYTFIQ